MRNTNLVIFQLSVQLTFLRKSYQRFFCCSPLFPMHNTSPHTLLLPLLILPQELKLILKL